MTPARKPNHVAAYLDCLRLVMTAETPEQIDKSEQLAQELGELLTGEERYRLHGALPPNNREEVTTTGRYFYVNMNGKTFYLDDTTEEALACWWPNTNGSGAFSIDYAHDLDLNPKPCGDATQ